MKKNHHVTILGRELSVRSSAPTEKVQAVEEFINNRLNSIGTALQSSDSQLILMLALLNTTEELLDLQLVGSQARHTDNRVNSLLQQLEIV